MCVVYKLRIPGAVVNHDPVEAQFGARNFNRVRDYTAAGQTIQMRCTVRLWQEHIFNLCLNIWRSLRA